MFTRQQTLTAAGLLLALLPSFAHADEAADKRRQHIEQVTKQTMQQRGQQMQVTSRYRPDSEAHKRGAIDIRGTDQQTARAISGNLGKGHTVIVEQPGKKYSPAEQKRTGQPNSGYPPCAPGKQLNTGYRNGAAYKNKCEPYKGATGNHTHIQPDRPSVSTRASGSTSHTSSSAGSRSQGSSAPSRASSSGSSHSASSGSTRSASSGSGRSSSGGSSSSKGGSSTSGGKGGSGGGGKSGGTSSKK